LDAELMMNSTFVQIVLPKLECVREANAGRPATEPTLCGKQILISATRFEQKSNSSSKINFGCKIDPPAFFTYECLTNQVTKFKDES
jgi:hypothetical protein